MHAMKSLVVLATLGMTSTAAAEEHIVLILPDAYFPNITYVDAGDTVRFVNASGTQHTVIARKNRWSVGPLNDQQEYVMAIADDIETVFYQDGAVDEEGNYTVDGRFSFSPAPIN